MVNSLYADDVKRAAPLEWVQDYGTRKPASRNMTIRSKHVHTGPYGKCDKDTVGQGYSHDVVTDV